ncbi:tRNA pseudouridine(38-40) synthase TruA [Azoarcus sp. KH32C]|uniref:tRNA pseudouridine(38-40) synthase TruA n=1 Tax=Azoarcus sp. KH32C TaxID=748247 RepID=UPI0002386B88|nr:tRNA pseudouridine(38-40) synthase TruA [Azoarcus sp. KH32C]BAL25408.1 tRNA pseudouridine synthase A [Azoarcus sp. KH32C]
MRIALGVEYAGDAFRGWQSQANALTVQDHLEAALAGIAGQSVRLHCAGRTDAGVHATAQVAHFDVSVVRPLGAWVRGVNNKLPRSVAVRWAAEVSETFHARFSAVSRRYRYVLHNAPVRPAILSGRVGWFHLPLNEHAMSDAAARLEGLHDFSSFRAAGCQAKSPLKVMHEARVHRQGEYVIFDFWANAFLHHMVRNLVGALVYVGKGTYPPAWVEELLHARDRVHAAPTFPADGLYLCGVEYQPHWPLPNEGRIIAVPRIPLS